MTLALVVATALALGIAPLALAATVPVRVPAGVEWVDSGLVVDQDEMVFVETKGVAITAPLRTYRAAHSGPAGQVWNLGCGQYEGAPPPCALDNAPYGALIGKVGLDGTPFLIGDSSTFQAPASGTLYLTVNDNLGSYEDNQAGFLVLLTNK